MTAEQYEAKIGELEERLLKAREQAKVFAAEAKALLYGYAEANFPGQSSSQKRVKKYLRRAADDLFGG